MTPEVADFLDLVRRSALLSADSWSGLEQELSASSTASREETAALLVERRLLTSYQAERLLQGMPEDLVLGERYQLLDKIGAGGMGTVFRARDIRLDRIVAIKVMARHNMSQPDAVVRFRREARALAQLALPHIVQAFDSGEDRGRNFLVMEFVQGIGLDRVLREKGKIPATVAADYVFQTAQGMQLAHDRGLVHRDLKPANLLLNPQGEIKILDLGLARFLQDQIPDAELTREHMALGTPDYMAPEQFRDARAVDLRADIYSLGCTLYHLIAGVPPFPGSSLSEKADAHENRDPPPLAERCPEIPAGLALAFSRMMAKRPADRFQSMNEVAAALAPYVAGSSPSLPQVLGTMTWVGTRSVVRRRRILAGSAAVLAILLPLAVWGLPRLLDGGKPEPKTLPAPNLAARKIDDTPLPPKPEPPPKSEPLPEPPPKTVEKPTPPPRKAPVPSVVTIPNGLTVAQDGTGQYRTIASALQDIQPGQTLRVLDEAVYREAIVVDDPERHRGIVLEAFRGAVLELGDGTEAALAIQSVPEVVVRGFGFRTSGTVKDFLAFFVLVRGPSPGVVVEKVTADTIQPVTAICVKNVPLKPEDPPVVVRHNHLKTNGTGVLVTGLPSATTRNVLIHDNRIVAAKCIAVEILAENVLAGGNLLLQGSMACLELRGLSKDCRRMVFVNNSLFGGQAGLRIWEEVPPGVDPKVTAFVAGQVTLAANLFARAELADLVLVDARKPGIVRPRNGDFLLDLWRFEGNWRDMRGFPGYSLPRAKNDHLLDAKSLKTLKSIAPSSADFLRPQGESALAQGGFSARSGDFPPYAGAVPPADPDAVPWDWARTWNAVMKGKAQEKE